MGEFGDDVGERDSHQEHGAVGDVDADEAEGDETGVGEAAAGDVLRDEESTEQQQEISARAAEARGAAAALVSRCGVTSSGMGDERELLLCRVRGRNA